jgi:acyl-CoA synthetase (AMP-forming)/AMP-acid ligase II
VGPTVEAYSHVGDDAASATATAADGWFRTGDVGVPHLDGYVELRIGSRTSSFPVVRTSGEIPKTSTGKIQKNVLRERAQRIRHTS